MANELVGVDAYIYGCLSADAALAAIVGARIYPDFATEKQTYPIIVYAEQSNADVTAIGGRRVYSESVYQVRVIGEGSGYVALQPAADLIDTLMIATTPREVTIGGKTYEVLCLREEAIRYADVANGVRYNHLGGLYRLWIREA